LPGDLPPDGGTTRHKGKPETEVRLMPVIDDDEIAYGRVAGMDISKRDVKVAVRLIEGPVRWTV
jgi:xylose isomerase